MDKTSPTLEAHASLRRLRRALLGDLSSYIKTTKRLQDSFDEQNASLDFYFESLDGIILKAFKVVVRGVRYLDIWLQKQMPEEVVKEPVTHQFPASTFDPLSTFRFPLNSGADHDHDETVADHIDVVEPLKPWCERPAQSVEPPVRSRALSDTPTPSRLLACQPISRRSRSHSLQVKRASLTHRLSCSGQTTGSGQGNLASERLRAAHDSFLGFIGSFIGLHMQSRSPSDLLLITEQSVQTCWSLLAIIESVRDRETPPSAELSELGKNMQSRLADLVQAAKRVLQRAESGDGEELWSGQGEQLVAAATGCVLSAGECVAKTNNVIDKIGDFEVEPAPPQLTPFDFEDASPKASPDPEPRPELPMASDVGNSPTLPATYNAISEETPHAVATAQWERAPSPLTLSPIPFLERPFVQPLAESPIASIFECIESSLPSPSLITSASSRTSCGSAADFDRSHPSMRLFDTELPLDSINVSITDSIGTCPDSTRDSGISNLSQTSTRATTPERSPHMPERGLHLVNSVGSFAEFNFSPASDCAEAIESALEKSYEHELVYNKEGQIAGGSLPALVEQLTTHNSTPDAAFVCAFYLTFRLFTTPVELTLCLIDRFDYIASNAACASAVRLRVYNVFKGWLESHWLSDDLAALDMILEFAETKLRPVLPAASTRLSELVYKVGEVRVENPGARLTSVGKLSVTKALSYSGNAQVPSSVITKSQLTLLRNFRSGTGAISITAFDPLELARQITIIESRIFCSIEPQELLGLEWTKKTGSRAVNVRAMSTLSTDLANLVADSILSLEDPKKRAGVIKHWVKVAMKCLELNNYDSLMAVICSLNSSMILRLKRTWELVSQKTKTRLEELGAIVDTGKNYAVLRQRLQDIVAPCIPFVGLYLTDLTFVDVGNQTTRQLPGHGSSTGDVVINFDKHMRTAKIIGQLQRFQIPHRLAVIPEMRDWMESQIERVRASDEANVQNFYRRSLLLEPREAPQRHLPADSASTLHSAGSRESGNQRFDFLGSLNFGSTAGSREKLGGT